jgi:hypothetical protein
VLPYNLSSLKYFFFHDFAQCGELIEGWFPICNKKGQPQGASSLQLRVQVNILPSILFQFE